MQQRDAKQHFHSLNGLWWAAGAWLAACAAIVIYACVT